MVVSEGGPGGPGGACLLVLPSDKPSTRAEAAAVEALLMDMLRDPGGAAARWGRVWRSLGWQPGGHGRRCKGGLLCGVAGRRNHAGRKESLASCMWHNERIAVGRVGYVLLGAVLCRAAAWRSGVLGALCSDAIAALREQAQGQGQGQQGGGGGASGGGAGPDAALPNSKWHLRWAGGNCFLACAVHAL